MLLEGEMVKTSKGMRWINQSPSAEMASLATRINNFYAGYNHLICDLAPINMVGSMLASETPEEMGIGDEQAIVLAHKIPLLVLKPHPLSSLRPPYYEEEPQGINLPHVLIKNACGRANTGVVLTGPLAGLIVDDRFTGRPYEEGMTALRVWNDDKLRPRIDRFDERTFLMPGPQGVREKLVSFYEKRVSGDNTVAYTSDFFFRLCREQGYPVDRDAFHLTRTLEDFNTNT